MGLPTVKTTVDVTSNHRTQAINNANISHTDTDRNRSKSERELHARIGQLGEVLVKEAIEQTDGLTYSEASDQKIDGYINNKSVEIKARKTWDYANPDLLVRKNFDLAADFYLQVDLSTTNGGSANKDLSNVTKAEIAGVVTKSEVKKHGEPFMKNKADKDNETVLVPRSKLTKFHEFRAKLC